MIDSLVNTYIIAEILQYIKKETWKQFVGIYTTGSNNPLSLAANFLWMFQNPWTWTPNA